jgi:2-methylcitrate dehydratase PrpD
MEAQSSELGQALGAASTTRSIAESARGLRFDQLPAPAVEVAKHCFLDWLGVTLAGAREPAARILQAEAQAQGGSPQSTVLGTGEKTSYLWAALINGTASHALDFDDVVAAMGGHPSVPVFPALLALAEHAGVDGRGFIASFVTGFEVECRVGTLMGREHYTRGFHNTATVGTFGAAAACAHLMGLDLAQWQTAFGLAGTQASGLKSMFGTMTKPFHAGKAAANGLLAARLAAAGFTANPDVLDVEQGFVTTQTTSANPQAALAGLGESYAVTGTLFKYHAACYLTHSSIEALKQLKATHGITPEQVETVRLRVPPGHLRVCNIQNPTTGLEGKFSLRFTAALALSSEDTSDRVFTDARVNDPALVALRDRVIIDPVNDLPNNHSSEVEVLLRDGRVLRAAGDVSQPAPPEQLEQQWERLAAKFTGLVEPLLGADRTAQLIDRIRRLETVSDMGEIVALTTY